jgi:hypothetical protein
MDCRSTGSLRARPACSFTPDNDSPEMLLSESLSPPFSTHHADGFSAVFRRPPILARLVSPSPSVRHGVAGSLVHPRFSTTTQGFPAGSLVRWFAGYRLNAVTACQGRKVENAEESVLAADMAASI